MYTDETAASPLALGCRAAKHILVVEDDEEIKRSLTDTLTDCGFTVYCAESAAGMESILSSGQIDLVILDVMLPGEDGFSICRRIRANSQIPIIMLSALSGEVDRIVGLEIGADDYIGKPFSARELVARIRALLRRSGRSNLATIDLSKVLSFEGWEVHPSTRQVRSPAGDFVQMTSAEFEILLAFCRNPNRVLSRERLLQLTHSGLAGPVERSIDVHVSRIRRKIDPNPDDPTYIKTVRLGGYIFTPKVFTKTGS